MGRTSSPQKLLSKLADSSTQESLDAWVAIGAAAQELETAIAKLHAGLGAYEQAYRIGDSDAMAVAVADLRELFEHLGGHCAEASDALQQMSKTTPVSTTKG